MKSAYNSRVWALVLAGLMLLAACGQKGKVAPSTEGSPTVSPEVSASPSESPALSPTPSPTPPKEEPPVPPAKSPKGTLVSPPPSSVRMNLALERTEIRAGEVAKGVLTVENVSDQPVEISTGGCKSGYALYQKGTYAEGIAKPYMICSTNHKEYTISPGEVKSYPVGYEAFTDESPYREGRDPLPPGPYDAVAGIYTQYGFWYAPPVRLTIWA